MLAGRAAPGPAPAGTRPVTFHGLTVFVPASWATNAVKCGAPVQDTVFFADGPQPGCGSLGRSPDSMATFESSRTDHVDPGLRRRSVTVGGHPAILGTGTSDGSHVTELAIPDLIVRLSVGSPSASLGVRLVRSAQITRTDANGCPSTMPYLDLEATPTAGPAGVMVAGRPSAVVVCTYLQTFLEQGVALSPADAARFVDALNTVPRGLSEIRPSLYLHGLCRGGKLADQGDASDKQDFAIRISYPHRSPALVYARLGLCGAIGFSNGTRTAQRSEAITELLVKLTGINTGWPGGAVPR